MFLPPYSPNFNPIEKALSRKAMLRKAGEWTASGLWSLIGKLVDLFQPQECANYSRLLRLRSRLDEIRSWHKNADYAGINHDNSRLSPIEKPVLIWRKDDIGAGNGD